MDKDQRVPTLHSNEPAPIPIDLNQIQKKAHDCLRRGLWTRAFGCYAAYFTHLNNRHEASLLSQINFTKAANRLAQLYEAVDDDEAVAKCLLQILNLFPDNAIVLNLLAVFMFKKGEFAIAKKYLKKTLSLPINYLPAEKNLLHVTWHQVPRWHFRMLNDKIRNEAFHKAITKAINANYRHVFDIGTGCGLLTLIAATAHPATLVAAFEENPTLATIATRLFHTNHVDGRIKLHPKHSTDYKDRIKRGSLVVTEIFDVAVFGEHAINSLLHAIDTFIDEDHFKIIPASVRLYITGVQSEKLRRRYRYVGKLPELKLDNQCIRAVQTETYDGEYITTDHCKFITETKMFLEINFRDEFQLVDILSEFTSFETFEIKAIENGCIDAFVLWFDLKLDDEITISTNPNLDNVKCWEQAVFNLPHPIDLKRNDRLKLQPVLKHDQLDFCVISETVNCRNCIMVSKETITFLNDEKLVNSIKNAVNSFENYNITIVDYHNFPLFGLLMCQKGADINHFHTSINDLDLVNYLIKINELNCDKFVSLNQRNGDDYLSLLKTIDIVMGNLIHNDGSWLRQTLPDELVLKYQPVILPKMVVVNVQLINSDYIDFCNKVDDNNCFNFGIAEEINEFTGTEHPNLENFNHTTLSNVAQFDVSNYTWDALKETVTITISGKVNAILIWYDIRYTDHPDSFFTTFDSTHYYRTCVILTKPKTVKNGDVITICLEKDDTYMKIYCD